MHAGFAIPRRPGDRGRVRWRLAGFVPGGWSMIALILVPGLLPVAAAAARPNIVLIMTDDQGYGDLGFTGNPVIETPQLDALARQSAVMGTFYVSPVCSPTRASLMTGRYHYRTRVVDTYRGRSMMDPGEVTVAEVLRRAGYATGLFGKWHLGDCYPLRAQDQGFEETLVLRGGGLAQPAEPLESAGRYTDPVLIHNGREVPTRGYCTDVYFTAALEFIGRCRRESRPFFVCLTPNAPHGPVQDVPQDLYAKYRAKDLGPVLLGQTREADTVARVFAMIENIDRNVGRLLAGLEAASLTRDTLVIFMVDNGPNTRRYVGPMRGMKSEVHDGGIRSPFLVRWPARLRAGTTSDRVAAHIDVMPTLLEAAGVPVPPGLRLDGRSLLPLLEGRDVAWPDRALILQTHRGDVPQRFHHVAVRGQRWKLVHPTGFDRNTPPGEVPVELYDMAADPGETVNLAARHPEVVAGLRVAYERWFDDVSTTREDNYSPPRIVVGTDQETRTVLTRQDWRAGDTPGWGTGGAWALEFRGTAIYDVEFLWPEPIGPGQLTLRVGRLQRRMEFSAPARALTMRNVHLPAGTAEVAAWLEPSGKGRDPYHIVLVRRPGTTD